MSKLDERQRELRSALGLLTSSTPCSEPLASCEEQMLSAVIGAVGIHGAAAAAVYAELIDLAVVMEVQRVGGAISAEVHALVSAFQRDAVSIVLMAELGVAGGD